MKRFTPYLMLSIPMISLLLSSCSRSGISQRSGGDDVYYSPSADAGAAVNTDGYTPYSETGSSQNRAPVNTDSYSWYTADGNSSYLGSERMDGGYTTDDQGDNSGDPALRTDGGDTYNYNYGDNYYNDDDYYYSSRLRRFYTPVYGATFFDPFYDPFFSPGLSIGVGFGWGGGFNTGWGFNSWNRPWGWGVGVGYGWGNPWGYGWGYPYGYGWGNPWAYGWGSPWGYGWGSPWGYGWGNPWGNPWGWGNPWCGNPWYGGYGYGNGFFGSDYVNTGIVYGPRNPTGNNTTNDPKPAYLSNLEDRSPRVGQGNEGGQMVPRDVPAQHAAEQSPVRPSAVYQNPVRPGGVANNNNSETSRPGSSVRPQTPVAGTSPFNSPVAETPRNTVGTPRGVETPASTVRPQSGTPFQAPQAVTPRSTVEPRSPYQGPRVSELPTPSTSPVGSPNYPSRGYDRGATTAPSMPGVRPSSPSREPVQVNPSTPRSNRPSGSGIFGGSRSSGSSPGSIRPSGGSRSSGSSSGSFGGGGSRPSGSSGSSGGGTRSGGRPR